MRSFQTFFLILPPKNTIMKQTFIWTIFIWTASLLSHCTGNSVKSDLVYIDTLIERGNLDSALASLKRIDVSKMPSKDELIYYHFLEIEAKYKSYIPIKEYNLIDSCITFYEKTNDCYKLSRAYYYKSSFLNEKGNIKEAIFYAKKAEAIVEPNDIAIRHHISELLACYNLSIYKNNLSILYARKSLELGELAKNPDWQMYAMNLLAANFDAIGRHDSANYYLRKCIPLLPNADSANVDYYLSNLAIMYLRTDSRKAQTYIDAILKAQPSPYSYAVIGDFYKKYGKEDDALNMYDKALVTRDPVMKIQVLKEIRQIKKHRGNYKEAEILGEKIVSINDSLRRFKQKNKLEELQFDFDREMGQEKTQRMWKCVLLTFLIIILILSCIGLYNIVLACRRKVLLVNGRLEIIKYEAKIKELQRLNDNDCIKLKQEIKHLEKTLSQLKQKYNKMLVNGRNRYEELIVKNGTTVKWTNSDINDFIEYSRLVYNDFIVQNIDNNKRLTTRNKLFLLIEHIWHDDEKIAFVLNIAKNTVRVMRKRIKDKDEKLEL